MLKVGDTAPDFTLLTHEGQPLSLSSLRGHKVLLWFYPKADTPGWTTEGRGFRDQYADFEKHNIVILGVSFDTVQQNAAFAKKFDFPFKLLCDTDRKVGMAYGACSDPKAGYASRISYLIDEQGKITAAYPKVVPKDHPAQVLADALAA
jgi:thioredoxin-dependent peroxiredoxin